MPTLVTLDPLDPEHIRDPYSRYAKLRQKAPVLWDERLQSWLITRHRDCVSVLRDTKHFAADPRRAGHPVPESELTIQALDPPDHGAVRSVLAAAYRAQNMAAIRERARRYADELLASLVRKGQGEFMADFAAPFSLAVICDLLGVDPPDIAIVTPIANAKMRGMDAVFRPEQEQPSIDARARLGAIIDAWIERAPKSGMLSALLAHHSAGRIAHHALMSNLHVIFNAGYQSPFSAVGNGVLALLKCRQDLRDLLDPDSFELAVEELIRYDAIAQMMARICVQDVHLGGERIGRGEMVVLLLAAANRDPEEFTRPDDLILDRTPNRHLGFGWGSHTCLGSSLARDLMKITLEAIRDHAPRLTLAGEPVYKTQAIMRCPDQIPVAVGQK